MISLFKRRRGSTILGLALDGNRLEAISLRRVNGSLQLRQSLSVSLALSPLTGDADLAGREIRNHLDQAGIRERRCAVCLPLSWVLSLQTKVPAELSAADRDSFLQIEAERGFHSGQETLFLAHSLFQAPGGEQHATLMAVPRNQLAALQRVLRAAKLKPVTFALGVNALLAAERETGRVITLAIGNNSLDLEVTGGGGIIALRSLDGAIETQGAQKHVSADLVAREIRITLGQLPAGLGEASGKIKIYGQGALARQLVADISPRVAAMGLKLEVLERSSSATFNKPLAPEIAASPALALAANYLRGADPKPDFLPPKVQPWKQLVATRLSTRKLAYIGAAAGAFVLCIAAAFGFQQWEINGLNSQWDAISPKVTDLTAAQDQIKKFRPWYDRSFRDLRILRKLTQSFPEDGSVSLKSVEIRELSGVTCSGVAKDNGAFSRVDQQLGSDTNQISGLHAEVRGQKPMQFTLNFQWEGVAPSGD